MWRVLKAPYSGRPAETGSPEVRPAIPTRDNSGLKQFDPSRAVSCQLVQEIFCILRIFSTFCEFAIGART